MAAAEVAIVIRAKNEASKSFNDVIKDITRMKGSATDAFSVMNKAGKAAFLGIAAGAAGASVALLSFTKAAAAEQANIAKLSTAIKTLSVDQQLAARSVEQLVKSREKLAFADDQIRDSLSLLIQQTGSYEEAVGRQSVAMDLARGTGLDLQLASKLVGKVTEENTEVLKRYGITIGEGATETEALAEIQRRFAGQGEAYAQTAAGQWQRVTNEFQNMQETIGAALLPVVTKLGLALADFLAKHEGTFQRIGKGIADFITAVSAAAESITKKLKPAFDFLDKGDRVAIISALAAVIAGPLVAAVVVFAATSAIAFATNPVTLFIAAIAGIVVAITLVVRHWDQIWAGMQAAPGKLLNFVKRNFVDIIIGMFVPGGLVFLILKHWTSIFNAMPRPVQQAMNLVGGFIENMVNRAIFAINKLIDGVNKLINAFNKIPKVENLPNVPNVPEVDFTRKIRGGSNGLNNFVSDLFDKAASLKGRLSTAAPLAPSGAGFEGASGGGSSSAGQELTRAERIMQAVSDGTVDALEALTLGLTDTEVVALELAAAQNEANNESFRHRIELQKLAALFPGLTSAEVHFRVGLAAIADHLAQTGKSIHQFILDTSTAALDGFKSAFDAIFSRPTREDAALQLQLHELERKKLLAGDGASDTATKTLDAEISRIQHLIAIRGNADDIARDRATLADNTLLTDEAQADAANLYIAAINDASQTVAFNAAVVNLQSLALAGLKAQTLDLTTSFAQLNDQVRPELTLPDALRALHALPDHGQSLLPSFAVGTDFVPRDMTARVHRGERIIPASQNTGGGQPINITSYFTIEGDATERTVDMIKKAVREENEAAIRRASFRGAYVTSGAYTPS